MITFEIHRSVLSSPHYIDFVANLILKMISSVVYDLLATASIA